MAWSFWTLGDDTEGMVFQDGAAADTTKKTLLHATVKTYNRNLRGGLEKVGVSVN